MNTVLVQNCSHKFFQNIILSSPDKVNIIGEIINNNLYSLYYRIKPKYVIFHAELITPEILQFISDFSGNTTKCFLYHDTVSDEVIDRYKRYNITHLTKTVYDGAILVPKNLINTDLFFNNDSSNRADAVVCFLDSQLQIPGFLHEYLYPKTSIPIKLFNMPREPHIQNLGIVDEIYKAKILQHNKYYLSLGNDIQDYTVEAQCCGAIVLNEQSVVERESLSYSPITEPTIDYNTFITNLVLL